MGHNWFGSLDLAWKYALIFGSALAFTLIAGFIKLYIDRRNLLKHIAKQDEEAQKNANLPQDMNEKLREKDEGDLFGIRAIEAGFYGGVAQSAPVSRAGSPTGSRAGSPEPHKQQQQQDQNRARINAYTPSPQVPPPSMLAGHASNLRQMREFAPRSMSPAPSTLSLDSYKSDKTITYSQN
jgi:hypothetical protein